METSTGIGMTQAACDVRYDFPSVVQTATPTAGQTVTMVNDSLDRTLWITPAGLLATLTIVFPTSASSRLGRIVRIGCSKIVSVLTLSGPASILNPVTAFAASDIFSFQEVATDTWIRIS